VAYVEGQLALISDANLVAGTAVTLYGYIQIADIHKCGSAQMWVREQNSLIFALLAGKRGWENGGQLTGRQYTLVVKSGTITSCGR
jgi:hypothetical protein